jgi:hypothetical protein
MADGPNSKTGRAKAQGEHRPSLLLSEMFIVLDSHDCHRSRFLMVPVVPAVKSSGKASQPYSFPAASA